MQPSRPPSKAYKSFYKKGKSDDHKAAPEAAAEAGEKGAIPNSAKALQGEILPVSCALIQGPGGGEFVLQSVSQWHSCGFVHHRSMQS